MEQDKTKLSLRIPKELYSKLKLICKQSNITIKEQITKIITQEIEDFEKNK